MTKLKRREISMELIEKIDTSLDREFLADLLNALTDSTYVPSTLSVKDLVSVSQHTSVFLEARIKARLQKLDQEELIKWQEIAHSDD